MQTFLPYPNIKKSLECLDYRRLGKQRVEAYQIFNVLANPQAKKGWKNHPIVKMWRGYEQALTHYTNCAIEEWINRGYNNNMKFIGIIGEKFELPPWFGNEKFHASHRANLLRKDPDFYGQFNWKENPSLLYVWRDEDRKWYEQERGSKKRNYF